MDVKINTTTKHKYCNVSRLFTINFPCDPTRININIIKEKIINKNAYERAMYRIIILFKAEVSFFKCVK
jgi:hypothetical protein